MKRIFHPLNVFAAHTHSPLWIALVGADGCGKTAVIEKLKQQTGSGIHSEIFVLERSRKHASVGLPVRNYDRPPHSPLVSVGKLCWAAVRWQVQYTKTRHTLRNDVSLILSDYHYFTGVSIDPLRYRYGGPKSLPEWMAAHLVHPHAFIFLDAPLEVIYDRKQEATREETQNLIESYRKWAQKTQNVCIVDASQPLDQVSTRVACEVNRLLGLNRSETDQ